MKPFVLIPAFNEEENIVEVIKESKKYCENIIVIDDGSTDKTCEVSKAEGVTVLKHEINLGKGGALKTGTEYAIKKGADIILALDSDGQHKAEDIPKFIKALEGKDIVFGYRAFTKDMPFVLKAGNKAISIIVKVLYGIKLKDTQCGYRAFTKETYDKIKWESLDYSVESEMIVNAAKHKLNFSEVEVATIYENKVKGTTIIDGVKIVGNLVLWKFRR